MFSRKWEVRRLMSVVVENRDVERKRLSDYDYGERRAVYSMITGYTRAKRPPPTLQVTSTVHVDAARTRRESSNRTIPTVLAW